VSLDLEDRCGGLLRDIGEAVRSSQKIVRARLDAARMAGAHPAIVADPVLPRITLFGEGGLSVRIWQGESHAPAID
jgi:hypothetical protein